MFAGFVPSRAVLPCIFIAALGCLIVPLPAWALDLFLLINLLFALFLFVASLQVIQPLKLSTLPTLLLLATLTRLCLNITTTRAILTSAHAGQTVKVFGEVVIQGNVIVGLILFSLVTLVQFLVVAKGAERVAEVAARFTLDAMPGKQMAIDAELRSGLIDGETARKKRSDLQCESRFYGALDGAMKFVKGDAIAGIVIVLVNIVGGFLVGLISKGLSFSQALNVYTTLSIGDGLLSQIPSFLNAVTAGLVVTRVQGDEDSALGPEVLYQLKQLREARLLAAGGALLFALVPGMPWLLLVGIALVCLLSLLLPKKEHQPEHLKNTAGFIPTRAALLEIRIPRDQLKILGDVSFLPQALDQFREQIFSETGLLVPRPEITLQTQESNGILFTTRGSPLRQLTQEEFENWDLAKLLSDLRQLIVKHSTELIDDIMTRQLLELLEREHPDIVASIVPTLCSTTQLTILLRGLSAERVPISPLDVILQALAESEPRSNARQSLSAVRSALKRTITSRYAPGLKLDAHILDPLFDTLVCSAETSGQALARDLVEQLLCDVKEREPKLIVTSRHARLAVFEILDASGISVDVIAFEDLLPEVRITSLGRICDEQTISAEQVAERIAA